MRPKTISDDDLLRIACACFVQHGPSVSTNLIAKAAGVSQATLFKRFKTKDQLMAAALFHESPVVLQHLEPPTTDRPLRTQLTEMCQFMMKFFRTVVPRFMVLSASNCDAPRGLLGGEHGPSAQARKALTHWFDIAQEQGQLRDFKTEPFTVALIGMMHARPFRESVLGDTTLECSDEEYVEAIIDFVWTGIAPEENK
jgi:AcrR family transcriptional regulator